MFREMKEEIRAKAKDAATYSIKYSDKESIRQRLSRVMTTK